MTKRLKTSHDGTSNAKLSFHTLVDMLEPDGPASASSWKSIVDRKEQVIVFFQVEYMQFIPQLSKCIRIRRDRTKTFEEILVPSVFFGRYLDDAFVEKAFGTPHLSHFNDLQTLLNIVDQSQNRATIEANSDGEQETGNEDELDGGYEGASSPVYDESFPEIPLYPDLVITQVNPPSEANSARTSQETLGTSDSMGPKHVPNTVAEDDGLGDDGDGEYEGDKVEEAPSDPAVIKVFNTVLPGDKMPYPGPLLDCQTPGRGRVPLTEASCDGKFLYISKRALKNLPRDYGKRPSRYVHKLMDELMGPKGVAFIRRRAEERKRAMRGTTRNTLLGQTPAKLLLGKDFVYLLEEHMTEIGTDMLASEFMKSIQNKFDSYHRRDPHAALLTEGALRPDKLRGTSTAVMSKSEVLPSRVFTMTSPPLACEGLNVWKVPLVDENDEDFPGMSFYIDKNELHLLLREKRHKSYPRKIFKALLGEDGMRFLAELRGRKRALGFGLKAENIFNGPFVETLRVHLARSYAKKHRTPGKTIAELDLEDLYALMDDLIMNMPKLPAVDSGIAAADKKNVGEEHLSMSVPQFSPDLNTMLDHVNITERLADFEVNDDDFTSYEDDVDEQEEDASGLPNFLDLDPTDILPGNNDLSGLVITEVLPPGFSHAGSKAGSEEIQPPKLTPSTSVNRPTNTQSGVVVPCVMLKEPPDDPAVLKVFRCVLPGDKVPYPAPALDCQFPGPGKAALTEDGIRNKNVYINKKEQEKLLRNFGDKSAVYLVKLVEHLVGAKGTDFYLQRREERLKVDTGKNMIFTREQMTPIRQLLTEDFMGLLEDHLSENDMPMSSANIGKCIKTKFDRIVRTSKPQVFQADGENQKSVTFAESFIKVEVFNSLLPGDSQPYPPPHLPCQFPGRGKVPLTKKGLQGQHLFVEENELKRIRKTFKSNDKHYVQQLLDALLGVRGIAFIRQRREQRKKATDGRILKASRTAAVSILSKDFITLLENHMVEVGRPMDTRILLRNIKLHWDGVFREDGKMSKGATPGTVGPGKVFTMECPLLQCQRMGTFKVPLVDHDDPDFPQAYYYVEQATLHNLLEKSRAVLERKTQPEPYPRRILKLILGTDGLDFLVKWRAEEKEVAKNEKVSIPEVTTVFTKTFLDTLLVHLERCGKNTSMSSLQQTIESIIGEGETGEVDSYSESK